MTALELETKILERIAKLQESPEFYAAFTSSAAVLTMDQRVNRAELDALILLHAELVERRIRVEYLGKPTSAGTQERID